jgi:DNA-3-methyladenine glycosylase
MTLLKDGVGGPIVEVEAYHQDEPAAHSHCGKTKRNASTFLKGGHVYVYRIHQSVCVNVVCGRAGEGAAVLVRALRPDAGRERIHERRGHKPERLWTDGPGKLCAALAITLADDGVDLLASDCPIKLINTGLRFEKTQVEIGPRIGISKATEVPWRFRVAEGRA